MVQADRFWSDVCKALGLEHLEEDPRFENIDKRRENHKELIEILERIFTTKPREEWEKLLEARDLIYAKVQTVDELSSDPQVIANQYIKEFDHPVLGKTRVVNYPVQFGETPAGLWQAAPELGQHTEEVLIDVAGYNWDDITNLKDEQVI